MLRLDLSGLLALLPNSRLHFAGLSRSLSGCDRPNLAEIIENAFARDIFRQVAYGGDLLGLDVYKEIVTGKGNESPVEDLHNARRNIDLADNEVVRIDKNIFGASENERYVAGSKWAESCKKGGYGLQIFLQIVASISKDQVNDLISVQIATLDIPALL
jgi:hypothetical protein